METFSGIALLFLGMIAFLRFRDGTLGDWLKAKFFNAGAPAPANLRTPTSGVGGSEGGVVGSGSGVVGTTGWMAPADGPIVSGFGPRKSPGGIGSTNHKGVDIDGRTGDPVRAARDGRVTYAGNSGGYGLRVDVDHGGGFASRYAHLSSITTRVGRTVRAGELLGRMGATGTATGDHLHFEIRKNGLAIDPAPFLPVGAGR